LTAVNVGLNSSVSLSRTLRLEQVEVLYQSWSCYKTHITKYARSTKFTASKFISINL